MRPRANCTAICGLVAQTEALQERWCLAILPGRVLCPGVGYRRQLSSWILLLLDPRAMMSLGPDLGARILHGPGPPLLLHRPDLRRGILRYPDGRGLSGSGLCPRLFLCCPGLELLEQFFSDWRAVLGLALNDLGWSLCRLGLALIGRLTNRGSFVARRRVRCRRRQILRGGDCLNGWRRRIGLRLKRRFVDPPIRHVRNERNRISDR